MLDQILKDVKAVDSAKVRIIFLKNEKITGVTEFTKNETEHNYPAILKSGKFAKHIIDNIECELYHADSFEVEAVT